MLSKPDESFSVGDEVIWKSMKFLVTDIDENQQIQTKGIIQLCNNILNYYDQKHTLHQIPCIIESNVRFQDLRLEESKFLNTVDDKITVRIPNNEFTKDISRNLIFKLSEYDNYKIISVNRVTEPGIIILKMEFSEEKQVLPNYSIQILNGEEVSIQEYSTLQLNIQVFADNQLLSPTPSLIFETSNKSICSVDKNGLVSAYDVIGSCVVSVKLASDQSIQQSININVIDVPSDNKTVIITGNNSIIKNYTSNYSATFFNNGVECTEQSEFYLTTDDEVSLTSLAEIVSQDGVNNICQIKANSIGYVKLFVRSLDGSVVSDGFRIQVKNLF